MIARRSLILGSVATLSLKMTHTRAAEQGSAQADGDVKEVIGIDCHTYPGDRAVDVLADTYGIRLSGFYLTHAPGKADKTWAGKREYLRERSFGLLPTYLGLQIDAPTVTSGTQNGREAVSRMRDVGFPSGAIVYLDIEAPKPSGGRYEAYVRAWMEAVRSAGYYPGVYGSYLMVPWLRKLTSAIWTVELPISKRQFIAIIKGKIPVASTDVFKEMNPIADTPPGIGDVLPSSANLAPFLEYNPKKNPHGLIRPGCIATQYLWYQSFPNIPLDPGVTNIFDMNNSIVGDPSDPKQVASALGLQKLI